MRTQTAAVVLGACAVIALAGYAYPQGIIELPKAIYKEKFEKGFSGVRAVSVGSTRKNVEAHLGRPVKSATLPDGRSVDTYEVIGTPVEGGRWDKQRIQVTYDRWDRVAETQSPPAPEP